MTTATRELKAALYDAYRAAAENTCNVLGVDRLQRQRLFLSDSRFSAKRAADVDKLLVEIQKLMAQGSIKKTKKERITK